METQIVMTTDLPTSSTDTSVFDFQAWTDAQLQRTEQALSAWVGPLPRSYHRRHSIALAALVTMVVARSVRCASCLGCGQERGVWFSASLSHLRHLHLLWWAWWPATIPLLLAVVPAAKRYPALFWAAVVNLGVHMLIGHKEYRFVWLSVELLLLLAALGSAEWGRRWRGRRGVAMVAAR